MKLTDEQRIDARQALGCGLRMVQVASYFQMTEAELRTELGMPPRESGSSLDARQLFADDGDSHE